MKGRKFGEFSTWQGSAFLPAPHSCPSALATHTAVTFLPAELCSSAHCGVWAGEAGARRLRVPASPHGLGCAASETRELGCCFGGPGCGVAGTFDCTVNHKRKSRTLNGEGWGGKSRWKEQAGPARHSCLIWFAVSFPHHSTESGYQGDRKEHSDAWVAADRQSAGQHPSSWLCPSSHTPEEATRTAGIQGAALDFTPGLAYTYTLVLNASLRRRCFLLDGLAL